MGLAVAAKSVVYFNFSTCISKATKSSMKILKDIKTFLEKKIFEKKIFEKSFWYLFVVYSLAMIVISVGLVSKFTYHFEIFALIVALFSTFVNCTPEKTNKKTVYKNNKTGINKNIKIYKNINIVKHLFFIAIVIILVSRIYPYTQTSVPLGYDAGIYKYEIEKYASGNLDQWIYSHAPPGMFYITNLFVWAGLPSIFILKWLFILLNIILGIVIFLFIKEYFNKNVAGIGILLYSLSPVQYIVFTFMYYKNIFGLILLLLAFYFLKRKKRLYFVLSAGYLGVTHRPTFLIFLLVYFAFGLRSMLGKKGFNIKNLKYHLINILIIVSLTLALYAGRIKAALVSYFLVFTNAITRNVNPGAFIDFFNYQFLILPYLVLTIIGFIYLTKKQKFGVLFFWTVIVFIIVYFKLIFFNRFIIHLDLAFIILAAVASYELIKTKKMVALVCISLLLLASGINLHNEVKNTRYLISDYELKIIESLNDITPENSYIMSTDAYYSSWLLGYSNRKTIAPGMFDYDKWNKSEWHYFWKTDYADEMLKVYDKPLYIYIGQSQPRFNMKKFESDCFEETFNQNNILIYEFIC